MSKINGTSLLVYFNGVLIASQKSCTVTWEQDLPGSTTKDSAGWEEHINGTRRATCDFDALFSTTGLSDETFMDYIISRSSLVLVIDGGGFPIVGEANISKVSINAALEEPAGLSGSFKFKGAAWLLTGDYVQLLTNPDEIAVTYNTFTHTGTALTSVISSGSDKVADSNTFAVTSGSSYKVITYLTLNSGQLPMVKLYDNGGGLLRSNEVTLVAGVNVVTLVATASTTCGFRISNSSATNFSTSPIYVFKA